MKKKRGGDSIGGGGAGQAAAEAAMPVGPAGDAPRFASDRLIGFASSVVAAGGLGEADARAAAELIVEADLIGITTHGVNMLPMYLRWLRAGQINPAPEIRVVARSGGTALIDGDNGFGHLVCACAARTAIDIARETGLAWVGTRRSNHAGAGGIYAAMAMRQGMVGIYAAVSGANFMAVSGGAEPFLGSNPIAIAVPAGDEPPLILDFSTAVASFGTIKKHAQDGLAIPEGWLMSREDGTPITDPARAGEGLLVPIGGHKGSGLSLMIGLLAGVLNQAAFGRDVTLSMEAVDQASRAANSGQLVIALDIARLMPLDTFKMEIDRHMRDLRGSARLPGVRAIRLPGDERKRRREEQLVHGIKLEPTVMARLDELAAELGVPRLSRH